MMLYSKGIKRNLKTIDRLKNNCSYDDPQISECTRSIVSETLVYLDNALVSFDNMFNDMVLEYIEIEKSSLTCVDGLTRLKSVFNTVLEKVETSETLSLNEIDALITETPFDFISMLEMDLPNTREPLLSSMMSNFHAKYTKNPFKLCNSLDMENMFVYFQGVLPKTGCLLENDYKKDKLLTRMITVIFLYTCILYFHRSLISSVKTLTFDFDTSLISRDFLNVSESLEIRRLSQNRTDYEKLMD